MTFFIRSINSLLAIFLKDVDICDVAFCFIIVFVLLLSNKLKQRQRSMRLILYCAFLAAYFTFVISVTVLGRKDGLISNSENVFDCSWMFTNNQDHFIDVAYNILLFMPFGFLLSLLVRRSFVHELLCVEFTTIAIEIVQMITGRGLFELSDILGNTVGGIIGILILYLGSDLYYHFVHRAR